MSFGRPQGLSTFKVTPPDRGSFPLDHEGECKSIMQSYMNCMKEHKSESGKCRHLSRAYLECRMDKGLMERDEMGNLGFTGNEGVDEKKKAGEANASTQSSAPSRSRLV